MAEFCIFQIRKYPFTEKFLKFTVWKEGKEWPRFHTKSGQPLKRAVFADRGRLRNPEAPGRS